MHQDFVDVFKCLRCEKESSLRLSSNLLPLVHAGSNYVNEGTLTCLSCCYDYPIIGSIPILARDHSDYLSQRKEEILSTLRHDEVSDAALALVHSAKESIYGHAARRESWETPHGRDLYIRTEFQDEQPDPDLAIAEVLKQTPSMSSFLAGIGEGWSGELIVDLGCNVGGTLYHFGNRYRLSLGVDISFSAVKTAQTIYSEGAFPSTPPSVPPSHSMNRPHIDKHRTASMCTSFVVADLVALPLKEGCSDLSLLVNVLDITASPGDVIEQACRTVREGGRLMTASPYYWRPDRTAPSRWLESDSSTPQATLRALLEGRGFEVESEHDPVPWILEMYGRYAQVWMCHVLSSRNAAERCS